LLKDAPFLSRIDGIFFRDPTGSQDSVSGSRWGGSLIDDYGAGKRIAFTAA